MVFHNLWLLEFKQIHTMVVGAARPSGEQSGEVSLFVSLSLSLSLSVSVSGLVVAVSRLSKLVVRVSRL